MQNKKAAIFIVLLVLLFLFGIILFIIKNKPQRIISLPNSTTQNLSCVEEGEATINSNTPKSCCPELKPVNNILDYADDCSLIQSPKGPSICAKCGDSICNNNYESRCNCPEDCAKSECGKEGEMLGGEIDRCCQGLKPKSLNEGNFGGLFKCVK